MNKTRKTEEIDDLKYFKKPKTVNAFPRCPARWLLHGKKGMCDKCPLRKSTFRNNSVDSACGLNSSTIDHAHRVVSEDGKTRHFIAYPYDLHLDDLKDIIKMCETHGLKVWINHVPGAHSTAMRLDFECK